MPTVSNESFREQDDFSGGIQRKTTKFQNRAQEVDLAVNASFGRIGGVEKVKGMSRLGNVVTTSTTTSTSSTTTSSSTTSSSTTTA